MRRRTPCPKLAAAVLLAVLALPACGGDGDGGGDGGVEARSQDAATTTTAATGPTTATTAVATPTTFSRSGFPAARDDLEHGGEAWALVLAGARDPEAPAMLTAEEVAADAGYVAAATDCDRGAAGALGMSETGTFTVSVYFRTEDDARRALAAFQARGVKGGAVALVRTYCLD